MRLRFLAQLLLCGMIAMLSACSGIPEPGPKESKITGKAADLAGFTLIDTTALNVADYRVQPVTDYAGTGSIGTAPQLILSAGDEIRVRISESKEGGLFAPLAVGGTAFDNMRIDHDGTITLPYAGRVRVAGIGVPQAQERIRGRLAGVTFEPQVYIEVKSDHGSSVLVSGLVKNPGRLSMMNGALTLMDALALAGGTEAQPHQVDVIIRRGKSVARIPLSDVQNGRNAQLVAGDEVILEANAKVFNALGAVKKTGQNEFTKPNPSLMDALSQVGGLDNVTSSNTGVFVFRLHEPKAWRDTDNKWQEGPVIFKFDMSKPETMFIAQVFGMRPDDTIYVTNAPSVEWIRSLQPIALTISTLRNVYGTAVVVDPGLN